MADGSQLRPTDLSGGNAPSTQTMDNRNQALNPPQGGAPAPKLDNTRGGK